MHCCVKRANDQHAVHTQGHVPKELWTQAGELGLLAVTVPEEYGGFGLDCLFSSIVWEEQASPLLGNESPHSSTTTTAFIYSFALPIPFVCA